MMGAFLEIAGDNTTNVLEGNVTLEGFADAIKQGRAKKIITLSGAGISTSCGIPDFRSPNTGLYDNLDKYNLSDAHDIFTLSYFKQNPRPFFDVSKQLICTGQEIKPSPCHHFIKLLHDKNVLLRHYTQNIDGLEIAAGLPLEKCIESHGHFRSGTCLQCGVQYKDAYFLPKIRNNEIPKCTQANCSGVVKPNVTLFGEPLNPRFFQAMQSDFEQCDMLIVMGTSLKVQPFASLVKKVTAKCPRLLINWERVAKQTLNESHRDLFYQSKCDDAVEQLANLLGWSQDLQGAVSREVVNHGNANKLSNL